MAYIEQQCSMNDLSEEDMRHLFETLIISYFSRFAAPPKQTLFDLLEKTGYKQDYFEGRNAEIALAVADGICRVTHRHFPQIGMGHLHDYYLGADLADKLEITDASMHGRDSVVIMVPARVYQSLKDEHALRHTPHRA